MLDIQFWYDNIILEEVSMKILIIRFETIEEEDFVILKPKIQVKDVDLHEDPVLS
jgi:hypothetical protein